MSYTMIPPGETLHEVGDLTDQVKELLEQSFAQVWVVGEIISVNRASSGHVYFSLRDPRAVLPCVMYRGQALRVPTGFGWRDGLRIVAAGRVSVYPPQGRYQFVVDRLQPEGIGAAELALRELRDKLRAKGYFDPGRKRPIPKYPHRIGVVTSPTGAAIRDILDILGRRWPQAEIVLAPTRVQGETAPAEIVDALARIHRLHAQKPFDVVILGRGGGASEDLDAFNSERVADAIFRCKMPVVSAVGHEIDVTIADAVADVRAVTPTDAAALVAPDRIELLDHVRRAGERLRDAVRRRIELGADRLNALASRPAFRRPIERVRDLERRTDEFADRLRRAVRVKLELARRRLDAHGGKLDSLSPLKVLARGYSLTLGPNGRLIRTARSASVGDTIVSRLAEGSIVSRVEEVRP